MHETDACDPRSGYSGGIFPVDVFRMLASFWFPRFNRRAHTESTESTENDSADSVDSV